MEEVVQHGLALEQTEKNSEAMGKKEEEEKDVRRLVEEEVARLNLKQLKKKKKSKGVKCQTCPRETHDEGRECAGLKAEECFSCGEKGHFQGAPICTGKRKKAEKVIKTGG